MKKVSVMALFCVVFGGNALGQESEYTPECIELNLKAREIESNIMDYEVVEGQYGLNDVDTVWRAYYKRRNLMYLVERQDLGENGNADVLYWFDNRTLFRYEERSHRRIAAVDGPTEFQDIERTYWFTSSGGLIEAEQTCDGVGVVPVEEEAAAALQRSVALHTEANVAIKAYRDGKLFYCAGDDPGWAARLLDRQLRYEAADRPKVEIFVGRGEHPDEKQDRYEWSGRAAGYNAAVSASVREDKCKLGDETLPFRIEMQLSAKRELKGCCSTSPWSPLVADLKAPRKMDYRCEEGEMSAWVLRGGEMALVTIDDANYTLPREATDTGNKYSDIGIVLQTVDGKTSLMQGDKVLFSSCTIRD